MIDANRCRLANDFPHHAAGLHDTDRSERFVRHADASSSHEHVFDIARIKAAIRHWISIITIDASVVFCDRDKRIVWEFFRVLFFGIVQVDAPGAWDASIGKLFFGNDVILSQYVVAQQLP